MARVSFYLADQNPARDRTLGVSEYTLGLLAELQRGEACELHVLTSRAGAPRRRRQSARTRAVYDKLA